MALYNFAFLGSPSSPQVAELQALLTQGIEPFGLRLGREVELEICPSSFNPGQQTSAAAAFFGGRNPPPANIAALLQRGIPILPVVTNMDKIAEEIPEILRPLNCISYQVGSGFPVAAALLECAELLPRQRRVFVSYRRGEASAAALQLFDALSARHFDVFLDTHGIPPAEDFQAVLWHRLCDSDVLVMLDTPGYFASRWTSAEFGRALSKGISVLRIGWPATTPSRRTAIASHIDLGEADVLSDTGQLTEGAISGICLQVEQVRSRSIAVRNVNMVSKLRIAVETIGGHMAGVGPHKAVTLQLADRREIIAYPTVGVPTSTTMHDASVSSPEGSVAVVFDHVGLHPRWLDHLDWLGNHISKVRWVKANEASWQFADWPE